MIHIVFQPKDAEALKASFELDAALSGDVLVIADDFAVGPLAELYTPEGIEARKEWWRGVLAGGDGDGSVDNGSVNDQATVDALKQRLQDDPAEICWIWAAQNKHDVSGYFWLMSQLKDFQGRIFI